MKIAAVIAEYNPFHNGHAYQIRRLKDELGYDRVIAVMSPDFVQRGEPALAGVHDRARAALAGGIDAVYAMPVCLATGSAEYFAQGGVFIADGLGADALCFGCETPQPMLLQDVASILLQEPGLFRETLKAKLSEGTSFPSARALAVEAAFRHAHLPEDIPSAAHSLQDVLRTPNNILAIEYVKALLLLGSSMKALPILRIGAAFHEKNLSQAQDDPSLYPSATALRDATRKILADSAALSSSEDRHDPLFSCVQSILEGRMPAPSFTVLSDALASGRYASQERYDMLLHYALLRFVHAGSADSRCLQDMNQVLAGKIAASLEAYETAQSFAGMLHTKDMAHTRINRALLHVLLDIPADLPEALRHFRKSSADAASSAVEGGKTGETDQAVPMQNASGQALFPDLYTQLIGFRKDSSDVLQTIKKRSRIPVITRPASAAGLLSGSALASFEKDMYARQIYSLLCPAPGNGNGYKESVSVC